MKRTLALITAGALALSMASSLNFIVPTATSTESQAKLVAVMPVDVQTTNPGVKAYTEIVDTTKIYQASDLITVATTLQVENLAKQPTLKTIAGKNIDLVLASSTIDLSYGMLAPSMVYAIYGSSNWNATVVASNTLSIDADAITYNASTQEATLAMKGVDNDAWYWDSSSGYAIYGTAINQGYMSFNWSGNSYYAASIGTFQAYAPFMGVAASSSGTGFTTTEKAAGYTTAAAYNKNLKAVMIPALNSSNYSDNTYYSPDFVQYHLILTGITKQATQGDMSARLLISAKDEFTDIDPVAIDCRYPSQNYAQAQKLTVANTYTVLRLYGRLTNEDTTDFSASYLTSRAALSASNDNYYYDLTDVLTNPVGIYNYNFLNGGTTSPTGYYYRGKSGTMEVFKLFKYSENGTTDSGIYSQTYKNTYGYEVKENCGQFIIGLVTEASDNPTAATKGLSLCNDCLQKAYFNENQYWMTDEVSDSSILQWSTSASVYNSDFITECLKAATYAANSEALSATLASTTSAYYLPGVINTSYPLSFSAASGYTTYTLQAAAYANLPLVTDYVPDTSLSALSSYYSADGIFTNPTTGTKYWVLVDSKANTLGSIPTGLNAGIATSTDYSTMTLGVTGYTYGDSGVTMDALIAGGAKLAPGRIILPVQYVGEDRVAYYACRLGDTATLYSGDATHYNTCSWSEITNALNFFGIPMGINNTSAVTKTSFAAVGAAATYSEAVTNTYNYGTVVIIEDVVEEETVEDVIEEEEIIEEEMEEIEYVEEEEIEEIEEEVPHTGDASANTALALAVSALLATGALVFIRKRAR